MDQGSLTFTKRRRGYSGSTRRFVVSTLALASFVFAGQVSAQRATPVAGNDANGAGGKFSASDLFYRDVRVNHDDLDSVLQGYLPVKRLSFKEMIDAINAADLEQRAARDGGSGAFIVRRSIYYVKQQNGQLTAGKAWLAIESMLSGSGRMSLSESSLAIASPRWLATTTGQNDDAPVDENLPATTGVTSAGLPVLLVPQSGMLHFDWTLRGRTLSGGVHRFDLAVPTAGSSIFVIDVPVGLSLKSSAGLLWTDSATERSESDGQSRPVETSVMLETLDMPSFVSLPSLADGFQRWLVQIGSRTTTTLTVDKSSQTATDSTIRFYTSQVDYTIGKSGIDVVSTIQLDTRQQDDGSISIELDPSLKLTSVRSGNQELTIQPDPNNANRYDIALASITVDAEIEIRAVAPFALGQAIRLPVIQVGDVVWRQGQMSIGMRDGLQLQLLVPKGAVEREFNKEQGTAVRMLEMFEPNPEILITVDFAPIVLHATQISRYEASTELLKLVTKIHVTSGDSTVHQLRMSLKLPWKVISVNTEPEGLIDQFQVSTVTVAGVKQRVLELVFDSAIGRNQAVTLKLHLQRPIESGEFSGNQLTCLGFEPLSPSKRRMYQVVEQQHLIGVVAEQPAVLRVLNAAALLPFRLNSQSQELAEIEMLQDVGFIYRHDPAVVQALFTVSRRQQTFDVALYSALEVQSNGVHETVKLTIRPDATQVNRLQVVSTQRKGGQMQWSWYPLGEGASQTLPFNLAENTRTNLQVTESVAQENHVWEFVLPDPQGTPFVLMGQRTLDRTTFSDLPLYQVSSANEFVGRVDVRWGTEDQVAFLGGTINRSLPQFTEGSPSFRQGFVYSQPLGSSPQVSVVRKSGKQNHWVWMAHVQSRHLTNGRSLHEVRYVVENRGEPFLLLQLPTAVEPQSITVDHERVYLDLEEKQTSRRRYQIPLNQQQQLSYVTIRFNAHRQPLGFVQQLEAFLPKLECQILNTTWSVSIPPGYELMREGHNPPTIMRRLFGPWLSSSTHVDTSNVHFDQSRGLRSEVLRRNMQQRVSRALVRAARFEEVNAGLNWAMWLDNYRKIRRNDPSLPDIVVDVLALQFAEVSPSSLCELAPVSDGSNQEQSSLSWLENKHLSFLMLGDRLVLTSDRWFNDGGSIVPVVKSTSVHQQRLVDMYEMAIGSLVPLEAWMIGKYQQPSSDFQAAASYRASLQQDQLWVVATGVFGQDEQMTFTTFRATTMRAMSWGSFVGWLGLFFVLVRQRWRLSFIVPPVVGSICLFLPITVLEFGSQAFFASLVTWFVVFVVRTRKQEEGSHLVQSADLGFNVNLNPQILSCGLLLVLCLLESEMARAFQNPTISPITEAVNSDVAEAPIVFDVYMPVDDQKEPYGEYVYLPEEFYQRMRNRYSQLQTGSRDWLLTSANYELTWNEDVAAGTAITPMITSVIEIRTTDTIVDVVLPFWQSECKSVRVLQQGQEIRTQWHESQQGLQFQLANAGGHELTILIEPLSAIQESQHFSLHIPKVVDAKLITNHIDGGQHVVVRGHAGATTVDSAARQTSVQLGRAGLFEVLWSIDEAELLTSAILEVDQYQWLHLAPHSVTVDVRLQFDVLAGNAQQFSLQVDPRLKLLPIQAGQVISESPLIQEGEQTTIHFTLERPTSEGFEVLLQFYIDEASGIGNIAAPHIHTMVQRQNKHWMAFSVHDELTWQSDVGATTAQANYEKLQRVFNATDAFSGVFDIQENDIPTITTTPRVTTTLVEQHCDVTLDAEKVVVRYFADIEVTNSSVMQHRFKIPQRFQLESLSMFQNGIPLEAEMHIVQGGYLSVFFNQGLTGTHSFELRGFVQLTDQATQVPVVSLEQASIRSEHVSVYTTDSVLARILAPSDIVFPTVERRFDALHRGRLLAIFHSSVDARRCEVRARRNPINFSGTIATSMHDIDGNWMARIQSQLQLVQGELSILRIAVRNVDVQTIIVSPNFQYELIDGDRGEQWIVLRPDDPTQASYEWMVEFKLAQDEGVVQVPNVRIVDLDSDKIKSYVFVPQFDRMGKKIQWDSTNAKPLSRWSNVIIPSEVTPESHYVFPLSENSDIYLRPSVDAQNQGVVTLADYELTLTTSQQLFAIAKYYLVPSTGDEFVLSWPESLELVGVSVHGVPLPVRQGVTKSLHIPLQSNTDFHEIEIVFTSKLERVVGPNAVPLVFPVPEHVVVKKSVLTVHADQSILQSLQLDTLVGASIVEISNVQLRAQIRLWDSVGRVSGSQENSFWKTQYDELSSQLVGLQGMALIESSQDFMDADMQQDLARILTESGSMPNAVQGKGQILPQKQRNSFVTVRGVVDGQLRQVVITGASAIGGDSPWVKLLAITLLCVAMGLAFWAIQQEWLTHWIALVPLGPPVLLGVVWWLFFASGVLGGLLIGVCLIMNMCPSQRFIKTRKRKILTPNVGN
ncbi:MAG: hypothetical protein HOB73_16275 [Planctomycetaceae bacterium]|nr:hypothetical protein [Planctomycetaceae bacterium]